MGYGAIIGAIGSIAGSVIGSATKGSGASGAASQYSSALRDAANRYIRPFTGADFWNLNPQGMAQQSIDFGIGQAPVVNQANMLQLQSLLQTALPGYGNMLNQMQTNTNQLLAGQVPTDVQQQIQRSAAFTSMMGGTSGAGTGTTGAITARDLGLTSLGLIGQGQTQATNLISLARNYLMPQPVDPTSLLPLSDLLNASEWSKSAQFQANQAMFTGLADAAAARAGTAAGANSGASAVSSGLGGLGGLLSSLSGKFGGGGGGNNNPNFSLAYGDYQAQQMGYSSYAAATAAGAI